MHLTSIASHHRISLNEIALANVVKINDRFEEKELIEIPRLDQDYPEQFPDCFIVNFIQEKLDNDTIQVKMIWEKENDLQIYLGDPLTDNSKVPNNYRFHDVFHLGHIAFLGWSPVMRHLMKLKRKSNSLTLEAEDRGRAQVAEEAITLIIYNYAKGNKMLKSSDRIDTELLSMIKQLVVDLEASVATSYQWERTIIESYKIFHKVLENKGGKVLVNPKERKLEYIAK